MITLRQWSMCISHHISFYLYSNFMICFLMKTKLKENTAKYLTNNHTEF